MKARPSFGECRRRQGVHERAMYSWRASTSVLKVENLSKSCGIEVDTDKITEYS